MRSRIFTILLLLLLMVITGCGASGKTVTEANTGGEKMLVYTSLFPIYSFSKQIGGEHVTVQSIVPAGTEPHDFEPSPKVITELNQAKLFLINGAGYETWIEKISDNLDTSQTKVVNVSEGIELLNAEEEAEEHTTEDEHGHENEGSSGDPHVWLDPTLAKKQADIVRQAFIEADPEHKDVYQKNYDALAAELDALDDEYVTALSTAKKKAFVTSHRAFSYLANRYGIEQIGISGLSPSEEPSQKDLQNLIEIVEELEIKYVAFEELVENKIAKTVQQEAGVAAITLNPLENVTKEQFEKGTTYVDLMKENLESLKKMLEAQ